MCIKLHISFTPKKIFMAFLFASFSFLVLAFLHLCAKKIFSTLEWKSFFVLSA